MKTIDRVSLWDEDQVFTVLSGIHLAPGTAEFEELSNQPSSLATKEHCSLGLPMFRPSLPSSQTEMRCSHCQTTFADREEQVCHYRLDWHRNNLRRSMAEKTPLTQEQFLDESSEISSISGSEESSDSEDEENEDSVSEGKNVPVLKRQAQLFFLNADGYVISLYRNILYNKSVGIDGEQDAIQRALAAPRKRNWAIILLGGGHFAAAIFKGKEVVIHKTFHNYTVRAKQGGSQGSKDNQSGTAHPKSSGASLRRYNEQSQRQHVQELMESWKVHFNKCDLIFYHAKHHNRATLFGGKNPILVNNDERLRRIPFSTKRAKFSEVKRVFGLLSEIIIYGKEEEFHAMIKEAKIGERQQTPKKKKEKKSSSDSKHAERKLKTEKTTLNFAHENSSSESAIESSEEMELVTQMSTFSTSDLGGHHSMKFKTKKKTSKSSPKKENESKPINKSSSKQKEVNQSMSCTPKTKVWNILHSACKGGNVQHLSVTLKTSSSEHLEDNDLSQEELEYIASTDIPSDLSKITFGSKKRTMLHVAAENGQNDVIWWLLEQGCDPSVSDAAKKMPFDDSSDKECRNTFRRFMGEFPDKYDYKKAKIPSPLTKEQELEQAAKLAVRRKAQRQAKQERQREKKKQERMKMEEEKALQIEEEEKKKFLALSDREKRALAAEKRFQQQQQLQLQQRTPHSVLRCFLCGQDITGTIPFEYNDNKFCTTKCVREHRMKNS